MFFPDEFGCSPFDIHSLLAPSDLIATTPRTGESVDDVARGRNSPAAQGQSLLANLRARPPHSNDGAPRQFVPGDTFLARSQPPTSAMQRRATQVGSPGPQTEHMQGGRRRDMRAAQPPQPPVGYPAAVAQPTFALPPLTADYATLPAQGTWRDDAAHQQAVQAFGRAGDEHVQFGLSPHDSHVIFNMLFPITREDAAGWAIDRSQNDPASVVNGNQPVMSEPPSEPVFPTQIFIDLPELERGLRLGPARYDKPQPPEAVTATIMRQSIPYGLPTRLTDRTTGLHELTFRAFQNDAARFLDPENPDLEIVVVHDDFYNLIQYGFGKEGKNERFLAEFHPSTDLVR